VSLFRFLRDSTIDRRDSLVNEVTNITDLGNCFDLSAFPLPVRVGKWQNDASHCWLCAGRGLHVYMRILPRGKGELPSIGRDSEGLIELNTCSKVTPETFAKEGNLKSVELVREAVQNMVMHEVYEALLFRGERIMDPHDHTLRVKGQPF
jgi:hypothetical protein